MRSVLDEIGVSGLDPVLQSRVETVILLTLKGIRNLVEARESLLRSRENGGSALPSDVAEAVINSIKKYLPNVSKPYISQENKSKTEKVTNSVSTPPESRPSATDPAVSKTVIPAPVQTRKPSMVDVHSTPVAIGPLDELRSMTIVDWRRLGGDGAAIQKRVKEKIELFKEDSYDMFAQGLRAWRESPLYQSYLGAACEALDKGITLQESVLQRKAKENSALSQSEFLAILRLNKEVIV